MRELLAVACSGAIAVALSACGSTAPETTSSISLPADLPDQSTAAEQTTTAEDREGGPAGGSDASPPGKPAMDDCLIVAAGISSALLAPLSFMGEEDRETLGRLEDQLHSLEKKVPAEIGPHFARAAEAVGGDGSGSVAFDEEAFRTALKPAEAWLDEHCGEPSG